ncbi:DUF3368 domain-containing protein [Neolewinella antarctica]|uniref:Nucleic acid-binding protein n=1 Tax=Neolewinella antarctica TaxID=442734 RepID=A0ABX0XIF7_9BACT|nr:DUF3368 domain-containing protein [Neolewinella antarctica]NJC28517.1 putative nucleic acid-binding protein [Neolewinella antarctica]
MIISDASTIIGLDNIDSLGLLEKLYGEIQITTIVHGEVSLLLPKWIKINDAYNDVVYRSLIPSLDDGEASSIALALDQNDCLLIIDERKGRRKARELNLKITGVTGIIIRAKHESLIESGKEKLDLLRKAGFRLSDKIYAFALDQMGEG